MANFKTSYPVDVAALKRLLPPGTYVDPVIRWNAEAQCAEVYWSSNDFQSPYSFAHEFTVDMLTGQELPQNVTRAAIQPITEIGNDNEKTIDATKKRGKKVLK